MNRARFGRFWLRGGSLYSSIGSIATIATNGILVFHWLNACHYGKLGVDHLIFDGGLQEF